jgi:hypothetical protein
MVLPKSPFDMTRSETWLWTICELEQTLTRAKQKEQDGNAFSGLTRNLAPLIDLTRQIASTKYRQSYRAGTSLKETLLISTAAQHSLEPDDPHISVSIERTPHGTLGFCILYCEGGEANETMQALVKTYGTDDCQVIESNLRRDLPNFYYPCEYRDAWQTLQPLMVRLWNETHSATENPGRSGAVAP